MRKIRKKRGQQGFSLAETLIAVLLLLMAAAIMAGGIPAAQQAYIKIVDGANAQVLLSTAVTELRDELSMASEITIEGNSIHYITNTSYSGMNSNLTVHKTLSVEEGGITLTLHDPRDSDNDQSRLLVSNAAASRSLYVTYTGALLQPSAANPEYIEITQITVRRLTSGPNLDVSLDKLDIPLLQAKTAASA